MEIPFKDVIDRATVPRMPWHDIHLCLGAPLASHPDPRFRYRSFVLARSINKSRSMI